MRGESELRALLARIDGRGFRAYQDLRGSFRLGAIELHVDHVQPDPFAPASRVRLRVPMEEAAFPPALFEGRTRRIGLEDLLAREGLGEVFDHAGLQADLRRDAAVGGDQHDGGFGKLRPQLARQPQPRLSGHPHIAQDNVGGSDAHVGEGGFRR